MGTHHLLLAVQAITVVAVACLDSHIRFPQPVYALRVTSVACIGNPII